MLRVYYMHGTVTNHTQSLVWLMTCQDFTFCIAHFEYPLHYYYYHTYA